jgi:hypothetical protein
MKNKKFKKVTFLNYLKFKIKWVLKVLWYCINRPFDILMGWM